MNEIFIYDEIGPDYWGLVSAKSVLRDLEAIGKGKPVTVRINSPGGDVVEAQAIYNALRRHSENGGAVTTENDALAASAASYIFMAGDVRRVAENSMTMIHKAWTIAFGNADDMRSTAGVLDKFDTILTDTYAAGTGIDKAELLKMLADETWLTASEALDKGFATELGQPLNVAKASIRPGMFAKAPKDLESSKPTPAGEKRQQQTASRIHQVQQQLRISRARAGV